MNTRDFVSNPMSEVAGVIRWDSDHGLCGFYGCKNAPNRFGNHFHNLIIIRVNPRNLTQGFECVFVHLRCAPIVVQFLLLGSMHFCWHRQWR